MPRTAHRAPRTAHRDTCERWRLTNLEAFYKRRLQDFAAQADALEAGLDQL